MVAIRKYISLTDTEYFCNRSFTLSYSMITKSWISFHSYLPNFYIAENNFFYSGMNNCCDDFDFIVGVSLEDSECKFGCTCFVLVRPQPDCEFTCQCQVLPNCELEGTAYLSLNCELDGTAVETTIPCVRPEDVQGYNFVTGYDAIDSTGSKDDACDAAAYLITLEEGFTEVIHWIAVEATALVIGNTMYAGQGDTSCDCIPDGWYFTDESALAHIVYHVENCVITEIVDCNATTTSTTTFIPAYCNLEGTAEIVEFPDECNYNGGTAYRLPSTTTTTTTTILSSCYGDKFDIVGGGRLIEVSEDGQSALIYSDYELVPDYGYTWQEAIDACNALTFNGYSDWRLPTLSEMETIGNSLWAGKINESVMPWSYYWTSTEVDSGNAYIWTFGDGTVSGIQLVTYNTYSTESKTGGTNSFVRPVRTDYCITE